MTKTLKSAVKVGDKILLPVATATAAGVLANQLPQNQRSSKKALRDIAKNDPYFNGEVAEKVAGLIEKMDPDEAEVFAYLTLAEIHDADLERNQRTLQGHINEVAKRRIERVEKALLNVVSKGADAETSKAYAQALGQIKKAYQNPYISGRYHFDENDFRRDPRSGRFQAKVDVVSGKKPLPTKQAQNLGIDTGNAVSRYNKMSDEAKSQFQQEYMQIANFLNVVAQNGQLGENEVLLQVQNKHSKMRHWVPVNGKPGGWDPANERVLHVEARPTGLTLGGAAFGLTGALSGSQMAGINHVDRQMGSFAEDWSNPAADPYNPNQRLYSRVKNSSQALAGLGAATGNQHMMIAGTLGAAVGSHGPEAEKVFGPAARKTAYRYRGTEKTPDEEIVRQYDMAVGRGEVPQLTEDQTKRLAARQNRAVAMLKTKRAGDTKTPVEAVKLTQAEVAAERKRVKDAFIEQLAHKPDPEVQRRAVIAVLGQHLTDRNRKGVPNKDYYNLQLEAGVTPPSEGFMLDKNGKVVTQAIGYGDDHYLPFNLKHLKKLNGGEYIRSRSVGGPTSEDIYTGLMMGAQRVTVVSRSGTFTVEFADDFRGKRRYNDKAMRMTRRYEKLLDAVQSETVKRPVSISPMVRTRLLAEVEEEAAGLDRKDKRALLARKVEEYKSELGEERDDFAAYVAEQTQGLNEDEARVFTAQMMNDWTKHNEFEYKLNGVGYGAALDALQEQFPYYIKTEYLPNRDMDHFAREKDRGYVEPGRNRPTQANAGWRGTATNEGSGFISASQTKYQRGRYSAPSDVPRSVQVGGIKREQPAEVEQEAKAVEGGTLKAVEDAPTMQLPEAKVSEINAAGETNFQDAAVNLIKEIQDSMDYSGAVSALPVLGMTNEANIRSYFKDPNNVRKAEEALNNLRGAFPPNVQEALETYKKAAGQRGRVNYDPKLALTRKGSPFLFPGQAYLPGADPSLAEAKAQEISTRTKPVSSSALSLAEMTDDDLNNEIDVLTRVQSALEHVENVKDPQEKLKTMRELGIDTSIGGVGRILSVENIDRHAEDVQRMRALNLNRGTRTHTPLKAEVRTIEPRTQEQTLGIKEDVAAHIKTLEGAADHLEKIDDDGSLSTVSDALRAKAHEFKRMSQSKEVDEGAYGMAYRESIDELLLAHDIMNGAATKEQIEVYRDRLES